MPQAQFVIEEWRDVWPHKTDCLFVLLGYLFANENVNFLGIVERFDAVSFSIAFVISVLLICFPLILMELGIGQLAWKSPSQAMASMCPLFQGVGVGFNILSLVVAGYTSVLVGYLCHYFVEIFLNLNGLLPWAGCDHPKWHSKEFCPSPIPLNATEPVSLNHSWAGEKYFKHHILQESRSINDPEWFVWQNVATTGFVWLSAFYITFLGIRWLSKNLYAVTIPLILLIALMVRALLLPGATDYIAKIFSTVDFNNLLKMELWEEVFVANLIACGLGFGAYITAGSYNERNCNLVRDSSVLIFFHVFITVARMVLDAATKGAFIDRGMNITEDLPDVTSSEAMGNLMVLGPQLTLFGLLEMPHLWTALLLLKSILFGLHKVQILAWNCVTGLEDAFLSMKASRCCWRVLLSILFCCFGMGVALGYTTKSGGYAIQLITYYYDLLPIWMLIAFQIIAIAYFYTAHSLGEDILNMVEGRKCAGVFGYIVCVFLYVLPAVPIYILYQKLSRYSFKRFEAKQFGFDWVEPVGWVVACLPLLPIPIYMLYVAIKACVSGPDTAHQKLKYALVSPLRYELEKPTPHPRYTSTAPGYVLLPSGGPPLAEPEHYGDNNIHSERLIRVSNI